jgi:hypothetical protein
MDKTVKRYYQLKKKHKEIEQELSDLRQLILDHCSEQGLTDTEIGHYRVRIVAQDRREYDDRKLFEALPDADLWKLLSKADASKVAGLVKLNVISEDILKETYSMKKISALQVDRV